MLEVDEVRVSVPALRRGQQSSGGEELPWNQETNTRSCLFLVACPR